MRATIRRTARAGDRWRRARGWRRPLALFALLGQVALAAGAGERVRVSQIDRAFNPRELALPAGGTIDIVNDDGDLQHHAYIDAPGFKFDSGDQDPGDTVAITFPAAGTFMVLCGIHPRMKLRVEVR